MHQKFSASNSEKGFAHLMLIAGLFLLIFVIGAAFLQLGSPNYNSITDPLPKPASASDEEENKVYTNDNLGLSFSYSTSQYSAQDESEEDYFKRVNGDIRKNFKWYVQYPPGEFVGAVNLISKSKNSAEDAPFVIWVFKNPDNLDGAGWFKKYWYYPFNWGQFESGEKNKLAPVNESTVGGESASFGEITYQAGSPKYYYISKNGKMYLIRVFKDDSTLETVKFQ